MLGEKELAELEGAPEPLPLVGILKRRLLALARDGLEWRRARKALGGQANLLNYIKAAAPPKELP